MCKASDSKSTKKNTERARKVVKEFAENVGVEDPRVVTPDFLSSLCIYCSRAATEGDRKHCQIILWEA